MSSGQDDALVDFIAALLRQHAILQDDLTSDPARVERRARSYVLWLRRAPVADERDALWIETTIALFEDLARAAKSRPRR